MIVPPDSKCEEAYAQIAAIARSHALVVEASGGVMTIAIPSAQREIEGLREKVLRMHCMAEMKENEWVEPIPVYPRNRIKKQKQTKAYVRKDKKNSIDLEAYE